MLDLLFAGIYLAALLSISPFLTLIVVIMLPLQMAAFGIIGPFLRQRMQDAFQASSRHQSRLVETLGDMVTVKAQATEQIQVDRFQETLGTTLFLGFRVTKLNILNEAVGEILGSGATILIVLYGAQMVLRNEITLGELIAFNMLSEKIAGPIMSLSSLWERIQGLRIARLRLGDLLIYRPKPMSPSPASGSMGERV